MTLYPGKNKKRPPVISFTIEGKEKQEYVRRVAWQLSAPGRFAPDGVTAMVGSRCANLHCINAKLLYCGTRSEVFKAAAEKGAWSDPAPKVRAVLARRAKSKLPEHGVQEILNSDEPVAVLADRWQISEKYTRSIQRGMNRRPLTSPFAGLLA